MTTLQERMALAFPHPQERGLQAEIAKLCVVRPASVSAWFNRPEKVASISRSHAELICSRFKLKFSPAWLAEGQGEMLPIGQSGVISPDYKQKHPLAHEQQAQPAINDVAVAMRVLADCLRTLTPTQRRLIGPQLAELANDPDSHEDIANTLLMYASTPNAKAA